MSYEEVGKSAKRLGVQTHRDRRLLDPAPPPPKLPGKSTKQSKKRKCFGYEYQWRWAGLYAGESNPWRKRQHWSWYATERQRDDAMRRDTTNRGVYEIRNVTPITRCPMGKL